MKIKGTARQNRGSIFYVVVLILGVLSAIGALLVDMGLDEVHATQMVYRSEKAMHIAESIVEEFFYNVEKQMNSANEGTTMNEVYLKLRQVTPDVEDYTIEIEDEEIPKTLAPNSIALCKNMQGGGGQEVCQAVVMAQIKDINRLNVNPMIKDDAGNVRHRRGIVVDEREKDAVLEVLVKVTYEGYEKNLAVTRSLKVVNTTMPPLSVFTLFVNDPTFPYMANWSSKMGFPYQDKTSNTNEQLSLVLDNSWEQVLGKSEMTPLEIHEGIEEHLMQGKVPPGRVYMNSAIVPLTNGNREAGMLQNAFFSAESEFLPPMVSTDLEDFKDILAEKADMNTLTEEEKDLLDVLPDSGKLYTRYIGYGAEIRSDKVEVNNKERMGYLSYFEAFKSFQEWRTDDHSKNPSKSGLKLFGRVELKPAALAQEDPEKGIFGRIIDAAVDVWNSVMQEFVNDNYNIRTSPTFVYGKVLNSYFRVMDYKYTRAGELEEVWKKRESRASSSQPWYKRWWDGVTSITASILKSFKIGVLGAGQYPIPEIHENSLGNIPQGDMKNVFLDKNTRSDFSYLSDDTYENMLDLPDGLRTPAFFRYLQTLKQDQQNFFGMDLSSKIPKGAIMAPYNNGISNYLRHSYHDSNLQKFFTDPTKGVQKISGTGNVFLDNNWDQELSHEWGGDYVSPLEGIMDDDVTLSVFNPFLYYKKATDYISSIYDFRRGERGGAGVNVLKEKYYNKDKKRLEMNGVIYITGTSKPLRFSEFVEANSTVLEYFGKAMIITFGEVIIDCGLRKHGYSVETGLGPTGAQNSVLTIVALGGITIQTSEVIQAALYSFMFPPRADRWFRLHGTLGASELRLENLPRGGVVKFDPSYYIKDLPDHEQISYYHVSLTDEIRKYSWKAGW